MSKIYHNPRCSTSRKALALLVEHAYTPEIIEYLKTPLSVEQLRTLIQNAGLTVREAMRPKETVYTELGLDDPGLDDEHLLNALAEHPILLNRPFVVTDKGTRLARPLEQVHSIL